MADGSNENISLGEAATRFLTGLSPEDREATQQEVHRFVRWYGTERPIGELTAPEIAAYAERLSSTDTDYVRKLELVRAFLARAKKAGWTETNLSVHLKTKKRAASLASAKQGLPETVMLTQEGYTELKGELDSLKSQRHEAIDEMRRAAADKDFRENAPLHAARERRGHLEGRIKELEETLKQAAVITDAPKSTLKAGFGNSVIVCDLASGKEMRYVIVNPKEVDPLKGKISSVSPMGKAIVGKGEGETVEVVVPAGKLRYRIERVER